MIEASSTALHLSLAFAALATLVYLATSIRAASVFHLPPEALLISVWYVPILYACSALYSAAFGARPVRAAVSEVAFETIKLFSAAGAFAFRMVSLTTALLAVLAGHLAQVAVLAWDLRSDLKRRFNRNVAARILSFSPVNALSIVPPLIGGLDVLLLSALVSNDAVAYYTVVLPFTNAISYSYFLARGLYPALLTGLTNSEHLLEEALRLVTLLAVPSAIGAAVAAPFLLYVLKPEYIVAAPVLSVAAFTAAIGSISSVFSDAVQGLERRDLEGASLREMLRSRIFSIQILACTRALAGIGLIASTAFMVKEPVTVAALCRGLWLALSIVEASILASWAGAGRALARVSGSVLRFTAAALAAAALAYMFHPMRLRELAAAVTLAALTYFTLAYTLDPWFRRLAARAFSYLRSPPMLKQDCQKS